MFGHMRIGTAAIGLWTTLAALPLAAPVSAQGLPAAPAQDIALNDFFYLSIGGTVGVTRLPSFNNTNAVVFENGMDVFRPRDLRFDPNIYTGGVNATIGYVLSENRLPAFIGMRPRLELSGMYMRGRGDADGPTAQYAAGQTIAFGSPTGDPASLFSSGLPYELRSAASIRYVAGEAGLRLRSDFAVGNALTLSPGIGLFGAGSNARAILTQRISATGIVFDSLYREIEEKLETWSFGGEARLDATWRLSPALSLQFGVNGALFRQRTTLQTSGCEQFIPRVGGVCGDSAIFLPTDLGTVRQADTAMGYRIGASLGGTYNWGWAQLTLAAFAAFNGNVPGALMPAIDARGPVRIHYEDRWSYGGMLAVSFPLN